MLTEDSQLCQDPCLFQTPMKGDIANPEKI